MHGACATLGNAAAKLGTGQIEIFSQHPQQWLVSRCVGGDGFAVQGETYHVDVS
jgi:hypothetical protein